MASGRPVTLRIPLLLLAVANLVILAVRLRPWNEITNLPGGGTTGFDPVICLIAYFFLMMWISGNTDDLVQKALSRGSFFGLAGGALAVGSVLLNGHDGKMYFYGQIGLLVAAGFFWGMAGLRGANATLSINMGIVTGIWSAMVSALIACTAVLTRIDLSHPLVQTSDPWKQYEGLAIGNESIQYFVHSLVMATGFLLICPLVGGALGFIFAMSASDDK